MILEISGHGVVWLSGSMFMMWRVPSAPEKEVFLNLMIALCIDVVVTGLLKVIFNRPRPNYNQQDMVLSVSVDNYSFPSGHATRGAIVVIFLLAHLKLHIATKILLILWGLCVSFIRLAFGRHHLSDVLVGFLVGYLQYYWLIFYAWSSWIVFDDYILSYLFHLTDVRAITTTKE